MIKNKCFVKKRRMGYCLLAGLLVALLRRYRDVTENGINSNEDGSSLRELCYNSL